mmetsp:Transcript_15434/g.33675  ORF Transcript_15434/g.33675 Transcript_15434/m.33675 type:complete len:237 (-) Transcript_15434:63-773(-)
MVDARFTAYRGVDHGHDRGGDLNKIDPPLINGRGESHHVPDHASPQRHERAPPVQSQFQRLVQYHGHALEGLVLLPVGQHDHVHPDAVPLQDLRVAVEVPFVDDVVRDDQRPIAADVRADQRGGLVVGEAGSDVDGIVASVGEVHLDDVVLGGGGRGRDPKGHDGGGGGPRGTLTTPDEGEAARGREGDGDGGSGEEEGGRGEPGKGHFIVNIIRREMSSYSSFLLRFRWVRTTRG